MANVPPGLIPAIGYALFELQRGLSPSEIVTKMEGYPTTKDLTASQINQAIRFAQIDYQATQLAQSNPNNRFCGSGAGRCRPSDTVGVRVKVYVQLGNGDHAWMDVTVNAPATDTPQQILDRVKSDMLSGNWVPNNRRVYNIDDVDAELNQVIIGGFENPAIIM